MIVAEEKTTARIPLKLSVCLNTQTKFLSLGISLKADQWDARNCGVSSKHPNCHILNNCIASYRIAAEKAILELELAEKRSLTLVDYMTAIRFAVMGQESKPKKSHTFADRLQAFSLSGGKKESTRKMYMFTLSRMRDFDASVEKLGFEQIDRDWLMRFDTWLATSANNKSRNSRNIHLRNIRAVFNDAIDNGITTAYPFRRLKLRPESTRKRSLTVEELRRIFSYPVEGYAMLYRDMFKLIFMLIGINTIDLYGLTEITRSGRIEYRRAKTGRLYSIKVEPEAKALIEEYRGAAGLLCITDRWSDSRNFRHQCNKALQRIGSMERKGRGGKKIITSEWPGLTTYWARHSWATIAASLDIPKDTIAAALGHGGNTVTDIYIDFDQRKVDEANRRVLDWVLYGRR